MMTQEEAAKYFVVAWVKAWKLRTYFDVVCGEKGVDWREAHERYRWLPKNPAWFIGNSDVRRYVAEAFRVLNDHLWDAKDNAARLVMFREVLKCIGDDVKCRENIGRSAFHDESVKERRVRTIERLTVDAMRRGNGHHWNVCK